MSKKNTISKDNVRSIVNQVKVRDFYGTRKVFFIISAVLMLTVLAASLIRGVGISIEFKGGTIATYAYTGTVDESKAASVAKDCLGTNVNAQIGQTFTGEQQDIITLSFSMEEAFSVEKQDELLKKMQEAFPEQKIESLESNDVAATSGAKFLLKCVVAAVFAILVLILYIAWRFNRISGWSAGMFAIVALLHDLVVVFGVFVICGFEIDSNFMAVILTILGYSVNDTIVIYDRIRENKGMLPKDTPLSKLVNISLSQTMRRTIRTSITTIAALTIVSVLAAVNHVDSILHFSVPMLVGMISGCFSSLCLAPMLWTTWKMRGAKAAQ